MKTQIPGAKKRDNVRYLANITYSFSVALAVLFVISASFQLSNAAPPIVGPINVQPLSGNFTNVNFTVSAIITPSGNTVQSCAARVSDNGPWFPAVWDSGASMCSMEFQSQSDNTMLQLNIKANDSTGNESIGTPIIVTVDSSKFAAIDTGNITNITNATAPVSFMTSPSTVTAGQNQTMADFPVCWNSANISGLGIANFSIFVKNGTLSWMPWLLHENETGPGCANFTGSAGSTFCFKSRATDLNGIVEPDKDIGNAGVSCTDVKAFASNITPNVTGNITNVTADITGASTFNISLSSGWNLISLPIVPVDKNINSILKDIKSNVRSVWSYDPLRINSTGGWLSFAPGAPSNLDIMDAGFGYWIDMANASTLTVSGNLVSPKTIPPERILLSGWNLIGGYGTDTKKASCSLYSLVNTNSGLPRWTSLWAYSGGNFTQLTGNSTMSPGKGFWVALNSEQASYLYLVGDCPSSP